MFHKVNEAWKQIESGTFENLNVPKAKNYVVHDTLFTYKVA